MIIDSSNTILSLLKRAVESANTGVVIADFKLPDMPIIYANPAFEQLTGYSQAEVINKNCRFLQGDATTQEGLSILRLAIKKRENCTVTLYNYKKDGTPFWNELTVSPVFDARGSITHFIGIQNDITARIEAQKKVQHLNQQLAQRQEDLEMTTKELESFSYSVSHDLRAPLRNINMLAGFLVEDCEEMLDEQGKEYIELITGSIHKMNNLINDLLAFARIGKAPQRLDEIDLELLLGEVISEQLKSLENSEKITIDITPLPKIVADLAMIRQLLTNLVSNAIKYSNKKEQPQINIGTTTSDQIGDDQHVFYVKDNGAGFDMKYADKLFQPFKRLHSNQEFKGTGVGLSIVARIAKRHGGKVWAESEVGKGATFYFSVKKG